MGGLCAVGYLAAPVLFSLLEDRTLAGRLAGAMFTAATAASLVIAGCLVALWLAARHVERRKVVLVVLAAGILAGNEWGLRPLMEAARLQDGAPGPGFGVLHGISWGLWLVASVLTVWLAALDTPGVSGRAG